MKNFCTKCGSCEMYIQENGTQTGLYCSNCGKWIKWLGKEEKRLAERHIVKRKCRSIPQEDNGVLSQFSAKELLEEVLKRLS